MKQHDDLNSAISEPGNVYGYGAANIEQLLRYLRRSVNGVCYAAEEEQYAADVICDLQRQLQQQAEQAHSAPAVSADAALTQQLQALTTDYLNLKIKYEGLLAEHRRDRQRIAFCLQEQVYASGDTLCADLDQEPVINGDYRAAIDRLMTD